MSQLSLDDQPLISVRIVTIDHYMSTPIEELDVTYSTFRSSVIKKVPILRVFGSTPAGQKTCLHLHGIFPYIYVPVPESAQDGFVYRLAASIDKALNISLAMTMKPDQPQNEIPEAKNNLQHVLKVVEVKGCPYYGYHSKKHRFYKVFFFNPWMLKRAADLLQSGAILGQAFQPHYSHVPYTLQFMMDYNLQGMNLLHLRHAKFRITTERDASTPTTDESLRASSPSERLFTNSNIPSFLLQPPSIHPMSSCELEIDGVAADILNSNKSLLSMSVLADVKASINTREPLMNPGLEALCVDEVERRIRFGIEDGITPPSSPPRGHLSERPTYSQKFWSQRFSRALKLALERQKQPKPETSSAEDPDSTLIFDPGNTEKKIVMVYPAECPSDCNLPRATDIEEHVSSLSHSILEASSIGCKTPSLVDSRPASRLSRLPSLDQDPNKEKYFNDTHIDMDILNQTKMSTSKPQTTQESDVDVDDDEDEDELLNLLQDLGHERDELVSRNPDDGSSEPVSSTSRRREEQDLIDTLEMSQICWDTDPFSQLFNDENPQSEESDKESENESDIWEGEKSFWNNLNLDDYE